MSLTLTHRARFDLAFDRGDLPYPRPPAGAALRLAFVGQPTYFEACSLDEQSARVQTTFVEHRELADPEPMLQALERAQPHVVVFFRPEAVPPGALHGLRAATVGFLTEPIPRPQGRAPSDPERATADLRRVDATQFDRLIATDPLVLEHASSEVWRTLPLPVADRYYADVEPIRGRPKVLFVGRSTEHREAWLVNPKDFLDIFHVAHGVDAERLEALMREHHVGINLHRDKSLAFENRVCLHLAAGHLLVSERLVPTHGLEPGIDYIEIDHPRDLLDVLYHLERFPATHDRMRVRGRMKAEQYRASAVWPRLVHDLYADLVAFGTQRR